MTLSDGKPKRVEIIARGVARHRGRILLCECLQRGYTYLPGGHVEPGEPAAEALAREFREEAGLDVRVGEFLLANENLFVQGGKPRHELNLVFHVEHVEGPWPDVVTSLEQKIGFAWVEPAALPEAHLLPTPILAWLLASDGAGDSAQSWLSFRESPRGP